MPAGDRGEKRDTLRPSASWTAARPVGPDVGDEPPSFVLEVLSGADLGKWIVRDALPITIGRGAECDLRLTDRCVSQVHCRIVEDENGSILLCDDGSRNGTFVNDVKVLQVALEPWTEMQVGKTRIRFGPRAKEDEVATNPEMDRFGDLVGTSHAMRAAFVALRRVAPTALTCLILGETGTGKELAVRGIHAQSSRAARPFVVIDCGAISETLIEDKLFGHERGAFTGAVKEAKGAFEEAEAGTIFLDEVGELPLALQPKLLRVLERREVVRLGSHVAIPVDVRVIAATHRDLVSRAADGTFRQDLYYRLAEASVWLPPLRNRREDIGPLARYLLDRGSGPPIALRPDAIEALEQHPWPGNVRELRNVLRRASAMATNGAIDAALLKSAMGLQHHSFAPDAAETTQTFAALPMAKARDAHRKEYLRELHKRYGDDHAMIAQGMGVHIKYARRLMRKYGLIR